MTDKNMPHNIVYFIASDPNQLAEKGAKIFCNNAKEAIIHKGRFAVALSGGSTPRPMHRRLAQEPYLSEISWQQTDFFWVDDRMVPFDHPDSNYGAAKTDLLNMISVSTDQIHPMPVMALPEKGAEKYQEELNRYFTGIGTNAPIFDLIILGIGKDGHIASLFPGQSSLEESERSVISVKGGQPNAFRLTLTYPVLNSARHILFLASGKEKASVVKSVFEKRSGSLPVHKIIPVDGKVTWLLDREAASLL